MMCPDEALTRVMIRYGSEHYKLGRHDCVTFCAHYVGLVTGAPVSLPPYAKGPYGAAELLRLVGSVLGGSAQGAPEPGDVVAWDGRSGSGIGIQGAYCVWSFFPVGVGRCKPDGIVGRWHVGTVK